jgi:hypothetical protein
VNLDRDYFSEREKPSVNFHNLQAYLFRYSSGIHAVRIRNKIGYIIVLPFKGQQIWDAVFNCRNLKMKTIIDEPIETDFFLNSYGCFMMHCGALRMGCPGPDDHHPLHGELPYADYKSTEILVGEDNAGRYMGVSGIYEHKPTFSSNYIARPLVKMYEDSGVLEISMEIHNLLHQPMELMYMCHVNFRAEANGTIVQSLGWSDKDMVLSTGHLHEQEKLSKSKIELLDNLKRNPKLTQTFKKEDIYDPEINYFIQKPRIDKNGWAHFLEILEDGSSNYVSYQPRILDHAVRWIWKNEDYEVLGLVLPSTCDPEGYTREKEKGTIKKIPGNASVSFIIKSGYLDKKETKNMKEFIETGFK